MKSKLKKSLSLLLALVMCLGMLTVPSFATAEGNWTDSSNYNTDWLSDYANTAFEIANAADLAAFAVAVNSGKDFAGKTVTVTADSIDLSDHYWTPIGNTSDNPFRGTFNGNGKTISGLTINYSDDYVGLFGYIKGTAPEGFTSTTDPNSFYDINYNVNLPNETIFSCEVKNLTVSGADVTGSKYAAAVVANCVNAMVKNVHVTNSSSINARRSGGVVADVPYNAVAFIDNCTTGDDVTVTATEYHAAGILARVDGNENSRVIISNCTNGASIYSKGVNAAGIAGMAKYTLFYNCVNNGAVTGNTRSAGITTNSDGSVIIGCVNNGAILSESKEAATKSTDCTSGIASCLLNYTSVVVNCTNNGDVEANCAGEAVVSGIVYCDQTRCTVLDCVNTGKLKNTDKDGKVYTISTLSGVPTEVTPDDLDALNTTLAGDNKNVEVTSNLTLEKGACTITPTAQEILTFVNSPAYLTIDLSDVETSSLQVNVSDATISVVGSNDKSNLELYIVGSGNTITYADSHLNLKNLYVTNSSSSESVVTVSAYVGRLVLAGTGTVEATVSEGVTIDQVSFATAGGTYTLTNYGTISHTQSDSNPYASEHTVCAVVSCTVTVNNYGTIEAKPNSNGDVYSYAVLLYCTKATVNEYPNSTINAKTEQRRIIYGGGTNGSTNDYRVTTEVSYVGYVKSLGANVGNTIYLNVKMVFTEPQDGMRLKYQIGDLAPTYFSLPTPDSGVYLFQIPVIAKYFGVQGTISLVDSNDETVYYISKGVNGEHVTSVQYSVYDYLDLLEASSIRDTWLDLSTAIRNLGNMTAKHWQDSHNGAMANQGWIAYPAN